MNGRFQGVKIEAGPGQNVYEKGERRGINNDGRGRRKDI